MGESDEKLLICEVCNNPIKEEDEFCPYCGSLFIDKILIKFIANEHALDQIHQVAYFFQTFTIDEFI